MNWFNHFRKKTQLQNVSLAIILKYLSVKIVIFRVMGLNLKLEEKDGAKLN